MLIITPINSNRRNILYVFARVLKHLWVFFVAILVNCDIDRFGSFREKKKNITFYDINN